MTQLLYAHMNNKTIKKIGAGKTGYLDTENWNWTPISHTVQKSVQNGTKILM
jgi:hypothetical protein